MSLWVASPRVGIKSRPLILIRISKSILEHPSSQSRLHYSPFYPIFLCNIIQVLKNVILNKHNKSNENFKGLTKCYSDHHVKYFQIYSPPMLARNLILPFVLDVVQISLLSMKMLVSILTLQVTEDTVNSSRCVDYII